jgi:hypothetical protein
LIFSRKGFFLSRTQASKIPLSKELAYYRGGKGKPEIEGVKILIPAPPKKTETHYQKRKKRQPFRSGAAIEPIIRSLKTELPAAGKFFGGQSRRSNQCLDGRNRMNFAKIYGKTQGVYEADKTTDTVCFPEVNNILLCTGMPY